MQPQCNAFGAVLQQGLLFLLLLLLLLPFTLLSLPPTSSFSSPNS
jgi:hypothetical protein